MRPWSRLFKTTREAIVSPFQTTERSWSHRRLRFRTPATPTGPVGACNSELTVATASKGGAYNSELPLPPNQKGGAYNFEQPPFGIVSAPRRRLQFVLSTRRPLTIRNQPYSGVKPFFRAGRMTAGAPYYIRSKRDGWRVGAQREITYADSKSNKHTLQLSLCALNAAIVMVSALEPEKRHS